MNDRHRGPLGWLRRWNSARVEKRRWRREVLEALAEDDAVLMEAMARIVEQGAAVNDLAARLDRLLQTAEHQASRLSTIEQQASATPEALAKHHAAVIEALARIPTDGRVDRVFTARDGLLEPELEVIARLAPDLVPRVAIDVGAHHGRFTRALLDLGFEVHALEPNPAARAELTRRLAGRPGLTVHDAAAGSEDGDGDLALVADRSGRDTDATQFASLAGLPLPEGLERTGTIRVAVRRLDALVRERGIRPPSLVKVDAEGLDLEVLRGLGDLRPAMLVAEFWDDDLPFSAPGARNRLPDLVAHGRSHGAPWHLVVFRRWGDDRPAFYAGFAASPERSWGNVLQFADRALFEKAREHLSALLPEAHFVAAGVQGAVTRRA